MISSLFPIPGMHPVEEYLKALAKISIENDKKFHDIKASLIFQISPVFQKSLPEKKIIKEFIQKYDPVVEIHNPSFLQKISEPHAHQGIILRTSAPVLWQESEEIFFSKFNPGLRILVLDGIVDVQNFAAISRSALSLGIDYIIQGEDQSCGISPALYKISAGAFAWIRLVSAKNLHRFLQRLQEQSMPIFLAVTDFDAQEIYTLDTSIFPNKGFILVLGNEQKGIRKAIRKNNSFVKIRIPMEGEVQSMNVSHAATAFLMLLNFYTKNTASSKD